jgi:hypothetical protein
MQSTLFFSLSLFSFVKLKRDKEYFSDMSSDMSGKNKQKHFAKPGHVDSVVAVPAGQTAILSIELFGRKADNVPHT